MTTAQQQHEIPVRLDFEAHARDFYGAVTHLDHAATKQLDKVDFEPRLRELVRVRASQLNGCAYCVDMHTKDARAIGESEQRLYALPVWPETPFFSERGQRSPSPKRSRCWPTTTCPVRRTRRSPTTSVPTRSRRS